MIDRRSLLLAAAAHGALLLPGIGFARAETERRLVVLLLRGALDGLHAVVPYAEPAYMAARRQLALSPGSPGSDGGAVKLDGLFALHASLAHTAALYARGEALIVHAVASPYRGRSHFDGQNILESGASRAYARRDGWIGRLLPLLSGGRAVAVAPALPLVLQGSPDVVSYVPSGSDDASEGLLERVGQLYDDDALLHGLWTEAMKIQRLAGDAGDGGRQLEQLATIAGRLLSGSRGPRIAVVESHGWDTHTNQVVRLARKLGTLDAAIAALETALGASWADSLVLVVTEFGRTVETNGTGGTDHGTASAVLMAGGAVRGGRVVADWPGLARPALFDGRDLRPTTDLHWLLAGVISDHFALDPALAARSLFPGSRIGRAASGLLRS
jgi:uncharacterized protein (DUF1501 family)